MISIEIWDPGLKLLQLLREYLNHTNTMDSSLSARPLWEVSCPSVVQNQVSCGSSDLIVEVGTAIFCLHKVPLVSRSGKIRRLLAEAKDSKPSRINLPAFPGGPEAFELVAKFCYGKKIDITLENVAGLRCVAHYLELTEQISEKNLEMLTEVYLKRMVLVNISNSITVLHSCESLLPLAEESSLVDMIINGIAASVTSGQHAGTMSHWWGKKLTVLNLDFFQCVLSAIKLKGLKQDLTNKILIHYAQNSQALIVREPIKERASVEGIVSLLPTESNNSTVPMAFLSRLMKSTILCSASASCKSDLERRMGLQLDQALLEDILIPANSDGNDQNQIYETDIICRIFSIFLQTNEEDSIDSFGSPKQNSILKVLKLLDSYLAVIAVDSNMTASKFIALAELLPNHASIADDGVYRAVDTFLKVHPSINDYERYRLCKTINSQKLSQEICSHAAQNERLPVQMVVQVLHFEQVRLRNEMNGGLAQLPFGSINGESPQLSSSRAVSVRDNYASVRRDNKELRLEVARMKMRIKDLENDHVSMKQDFVQSNPTNNFLKSLSKKFKFVKGVL